MSKIATNVIELPRKAVANVRVSPIPPARVPTGWLTTDEDEINRRRRRARNSPIKVTSLDRRRRVFGDFDVRTGDEGPVYRVELRSVVARENSCTCPDYEVNGLGTCKHVEAALLYAHEQWPRDYARAVRKATSPRFEIFLRPTADGPVVVHTCDSHPRLAAVRRALSPHFGPDGSLRGDPLVTLPALTRTLAALPPAQQTQVRVSATLPRWFEMQRNRQVPTWVQPLRQRAGTEPQRVNPLATPLFPYQVKGMLHLAAKGRAILADDMGLGKTIQALAAAELLRRHERIERVLVVCPVSVKGEWEEQINRFTEQPVQLVSGPPHVRKEMYDRAPFYTVTNYEQVRNDVAAINDRLRPDLVILDEAQRFKNFRTLTARKVKQLRSRFAFVLTGTPLENRIDELYSIVQFLDPHLLGPLFRFNRAYHQVDEDGHMCGYHNLQMLHRRVSHLMLRRRKRQVEKELPGRTVERLFVPMHEAQQGPYAAYERKVAGILHHARNRPLMPAEFEELQRHLACMRMVCDTPYILNPKCRISPKVSVLQGLLDEVLQDPESKVVIFSEWERMLQLVADSLRRPDRSYAWHTGSVPQDKRRLEVLRFKESPACRILLSTDAGATGLNLQAANVVINLDLPWNPAKLEQRIARSWRKFQTRSVRVINLVTAHSIEERMLDTIAQKQALADRVLDGADGPDEMALPSTGRSATIDRIGKLVTLENEETERRDPSGETKAERPEQEDPNDHDTASADGSDDRGERVDNGPHEPNVPEPQNENPQSQIRRSPTLPRDRRPSLDQRRALARTRLARVKRRTLVPRTGSDVRAGESPSPSVGEGLGWGAPRCP